MRAIQRTRMGQFNSNYDHLALLDLVRRVIARIWAAHAKELHLLGRTGRALVSQSLFDRVAPEVEGSPVPSARAIAQRLGMSWLDVVRVASSDGVSAAQISLGVRDELGGEARREFAPEEVIDALRSSAARLGRTPSDTDYKNDRRRLLQASRRAYLSGTLTAGSLPTEDQIVTQQTGTWRQALELAGLPPDPKALRKGDRAGEGERGVPQVMLLDVCLDHTKALASRAALEQLARVLDVALADHRLLQGDAVKQLRANRRAARLRTPRKPTRQSSPRFQLTEEQKTKIREELARRLGVSPD